MVYPLSIFILYSPSRRKQFDQFARFLARCDHYNDCQKILVADATTDIKPDQYQTIVVPRQGNHFCWSDAWSAAMAAVNSDKILYLDCDRLLPPWYLTKLIDTLTDYEIVYPERLWNLNQETTDEAIINHSAISPDLFWVEYPTTNSAKFPCRGPMSGTSAFTNKTYDYIGPLDRSYIGWGYPDLDYQEAAKSKGCTFRPIDTEVIHLKHTYEIPWTNFLKVNAWNGVRFYQKWNIRHTTHFKNSLLQIEMTTEQLLNITLDDLLAAN